MPTKPEYQKFLDYTNFYIEKLREERRKAIGTRKDTISIKLHTLFVARWVASKRFDIDAVNIRKKLCYSHTWLGTNVVDQLFFLKHYEFDANDLDKYKNEFKGESHYDMEII